MNRRTGLLATLAAACVLLPSGVFAQTYTFTQVGPANLPAVGPAFTETLFTGGTEPSSSATQACFEFADESVTATPLNISVNHVAGTNFTYITFLVPASYLAAVPPSDFAASGGFVDGMVYLVPTGSTCNGSVDTTYTSAVTVSINRPTFTSTSTSSLPVTNTAATNAKPVNFTVNGSYFAPTTIVEFTGLPAGTVTATTKYVNAQTLIVTSPQIPSNAGPAGIQIITNGGDGPYPASSTGSVSFYSLEQAIVSAANVAPNPGVAGATLTFTATTEISSSSNSPQVGGVPTGPMLYSATQGGSQVGNSVTGTLITNPTSTSFATPSGLVDTNVNSDDVLAIYADVNGDGLPDAILQTHEGDGALITVHPGGYPLGTYGSAPVTVLPSACSLNAMVAGDVNGDGLADLVLICYNAASGLDDLDVMLSNGDGTFTLSNTVDSNNFSALVLGDFFHHGKLDIAAAEFTGGALSQFNVYKGNGDGTFTGPTTSSFTDDALSYPNDLEVGDLNGDGYPDLVVNAEETEVVVLISNGDGTLGNTAAQTANYTYSIPSDFLADRLTVADVNNDNLMDVVFTQMAGLPPGPIHRHDAVGKAEAAARAKRRNVKPHASGYSANALINTTAAGVVSFSGPISSTLGGAQGPIVVADFDGDGIKDLLESDGVNLNVYSGDNKGDFAATDTSLTTPLPANAQGLFALNGTDLDGDGNTDALYVAQLYDSSSSSYSWSMNAGLVTGTASATTVGTPNLPIGSYTANFAYNGDAIYTGDTATESPLNIVGETTTTALGASIPSPTYGQAETLTATVAQNATTPDAPTGSVVFTMGATTLGTVMISSGKAQLTGVQLPAGTDNLSATYGGDSYNATSVGTLNLTVKQATPTLTWAAPAAITYGTALSATQLDATAAGVSGALAGTFAYMPASGTVLAAGVQTLSVTFTPTDTTDYSTATKTVNLTVNKATPTLTWAAPAAITYGTALSATQLDATATGVSGALAGTFAYMPASGTVLDAGVQTLSVTFTPTDTTDYSTATKTVNLTVNKATPTLTWAAPAAITYGTALSATQLDATAAGVSGALAGTFAYMPASGTVLAAGVQTLSVTFTPTDTTDYSTATKTVNLTVNKAALTVTANNLSKTQGQNNPTLTYMIAGFVNGDNQSTATTGAPNLSTTAAQNSPVGTYPITITQGTLAAPNYTPSFVNGVLTVNATGLSITRASLPLDTVNTAYTATLAATGGVTPYKWSVTGGALPAGLQLDANTGVISGTPTGVGNTSFTVQVSDAESTPMTATAEFSIGVNTPQSVEYTFCVGAAPCPGNPSASLLQASDGNYYGVGANSEFNEGVVFKLDSTGAYSAVYSFCSVGGVNCTDGSFPSSVIQGTDGNFYGATSAGGANNQGSIFQLTPAGVLTTVYSFTGGADGEFPDSQLVQGSDGSFYGTTTEVGSSFTGTIFKVTPAGAFTTLYTFCSLANCTDGTLPNGPLVQGSDGNFYGTTSNGGATNTTCEDLEDDVGCGTAFKITPTGTLTTLYTFCTLANCTDGAVPQGGLVQASDGNFYGTAVNGGAADNGTAFRMSPSGTLATLYYFCAQFDCADGVNPGPSLFLASDGKFYGTSDGGLGNPASGTAFQMTSSGALTTLYNFCSQANCADGSYSNGLLQNSNGNIYGITSSGGDQTNSDGVAYQFSPALAAPMQLTLSTSSVAAGSPVTLTYKVLNAYSTSMQQCAAFIQNGATTAAAGNWTGIQTGALTGGVYTGSASITPTVPGTYSYALTCGGIESAASGNLTVTTDTTTTALAPSITAPVYGAPISLTATITPQNLDGPSTANVSFYDGTTLLGTVASSEFSPPPPGARFSGDGFTATLTGVELAAGAHNLSAVFAGDATYQTSTGKDSLTVTPAVLTATAANLSKLQGAANPTLTYTLTGFQYTDNQANATTGAPTLSTTATQSSPAGTYPITIMQGTLAAPNYTFSFANGVLTVNAATLAINPISLSPVTVNFAYSASLTASGGVAPYTWSIIAGALPAGLQLGASNGIISGAPTAVGVASFTVQVTDAESTPMTASASFVLGINTAQSVLYTFCADVVNICTSSDEPNSGLILARDGNYYGTSNYGGADGHGTLFQLTPGGTLSVLYSFCSQGGDSCTDGAYPYGVVQGTDGNLYGATSSGGTNGDGTVYMFTPAGVLTTLYSFTDGNDGGTPTSSLIQANDGNFYGTTSSGGANPNNCGAGGCGTIFKITPAGALTTLYDFCNVNDCADGFGPSSMTLLQASDGNIYGTTEYGGNESDDCFGSGTCGTLFKLAPNGTLTTLYTFCNRISCLDGGQPTAGLVQGADGNLYGTTSVGGSSELSGTAFKITTAGVLTTLHNFCASGDCVDGANPYTPLLPGSDGNLYGTTSTGGASSEAADYTGSAFELTPAGALTTLYSFCSQSNCSDGGDPNSLLQGSDGNFYGTTYAGGDPDSQAGAAFRLSPSPALAAPVQLTLGSSSVTAGSPVTLTFNVLNAFSTSLQQCAAFIQNGATTAAAGNWTGVQAGTLTGGVYSGSASITPTVAGTYTYALTCGGVESGFSAPLTVTAAVTPSISSISPPSVTAGSPDTTITVSGAGFSSNDSVVLVPNPLTTTYNSATGTLSATIPAAALRGPGELFIEVMDNSTGLTSAAVGFGVTNIPTTTSLTASIMAPMYGTPISLTATITPQNQDGASTAAVNFYDGQTLLGTVNSSGFTATLTGVQLSAGAHNLSADFGGDYLYQASSGTLQVAVAKAVLTATANNLSKLQGQANPTLTYTLSGFQYTDTQGSATSGAPALSTTATQDSPAGMYPISITQGTLAATNYTFQFVNGTLTVSATGLNITTTSLPVGKVGTAYSDTLAATGGVTPYTWSVTIGTLPAGLQLNPNTGVISGTPTAAGVVTFTVQAADSESTPVTATAQLSIAIDAVENVLSAFCQQVGCPDGANPRDGVIQANDGSLYGTTTFDGAHGGGTVFKISPTGVVTTLYDFCSQSNCADGSEPKGLREGADGNFYSTTLSGGNNNAGTIFKITPAGVFTSLYQFCAQSNCPDGQTPTDVLIPGSDGNFYGSTGYGGSASEGTVFKITPAGTLTTLYNFCSQSNCTDGTVPPAGLLQGADGNFYGVTTGGGANSAGTVFQITPGGTLSTLYSFCGINNCADGSGPNSNLVQGADGNFYGLTNSGGNESGSGTIFNVTPGGALTTLYQFCSQANCADGQQPSVGMVLGSDGNFYGTTQTQGADDGGTFFQLSLGGAGGPPATLNTMYTFCSLTNCADGSTPEGFVQANNGNFYGTAEYGGGGYNAGLVYELPNAPALAAPVQLALSSSNIAYGSPVTLSWQVLNAFSTTMQQCYAFVNIGGPNGGAWTGLQAGTLADGIYSGSAAITPTAAGTYTYSLTCGGVESALSGTLTVTPAVLTVTANNLGKQQGQPNPPLTYTITGFELTDNQANSTAGAPTLSTTATQSSPAGTYPINITQGTLAATSYTFNFVNGILVVGSYSLTSISPNTAVAGSPATAITLTGIGFSAGDSVLVNGTSIGGTYQSAGGTLTATIPASDLATPATLQIAVIDAATGQTTASVPFTVTTVPTTTGLTSSVSAPVYGTAISLTATITPQKSDGASTASITFYDGTTTLGTAASSGFSATLPNVELSAGVHSLSAVFAGDTVYQTSTGTLSLTVAKAVLTAAANNLSKQQGAANPPLTYTLSGFQYSDTQSTATSGQPTLTTTATQSSPAGTYPINISQGTLDAANYTFSFVNGTLTVGSAVQLPVGTTSATQTATLTFTADGTANALNVLTLGAPNLDFKFVTGGNCAIGTAYNVGDTCTVNYTFTPAHPGQRLGGITATDTSGNVLANAYITGIGTGPQITFGSANNQTALITIPADEPYGVAVDASGDIFFANVANNTVDKVPAGCTTAACVTTLGGGFAGSQGVAVDGSGNVFVSNFNSNQINEVPPSCTNADCVVVVGGGFSVPSSVAVDGVGNVYVTDEGNNAVKEIPPGCFASNCVSTLGGGLNSPIGIAVDSAGNVYVGGGSSISEIPLGCTSAACVISLGGGIGAPFGVAVDASGTVFVADGESNAVKSIPPGCTSAACVTTLPGSFAATGIAVDGSGNIFVANDGQSTISKLDFADPPALTFAAIPVGSASAAQTVTLADDGNAPLTFTGLAASNANFMLSGSTCTPTGALAAAGSCTVGIEFTPQTAGPQSGQVNATDNDLNQTGSVQRIPLTGAAGGVAPTVSVSAVTVPAGSTTGVTVTATETGTEGAATGGVVTFSVVAPATGSFAPATCTLTEAGTCTSTYIPTGSLAAGTYANTIVAGFAAVGNYTAATATSTLTVTPVQSNFALTSIAPDSANIGAADTKITLTGTGFAKGDQAQVNGTSVPTAYINATTLTATIPAADLAAPATLEISVFQPDGETSTNALPFTVVVPPVNIVFTGPSTAPSATQPDLTFTLTNPYPVELTATLTLTFEGAGGADDPSVEFANGSRTYSFNIAANTTTTPAIQLQTGTDAGTITVALTVAITSTGLDVTPDGLAPVTIAIPAEAPTITNMTLTRNGNTVTVNIMGYSNTRDMTSADFTFAGAYGVAIDDPNITVPAATLFSAWYSTAPSQAYGSEFLYTQTFNLSGDNSIIGQVAVTLTNSAGISGSAVAQ